jgi:hypothetical protein
MHHTAFAVFALPPQERNFLLMERAASFAAV